MAEHKCGRLRLRHVADEGNGYKTITAACDECHEVVTFKHCLPKGIAEFAVDTGQNRLVEPAVFEISHEPLEEMVWLDGTPVLHQPVQDMTKLEVIDFPTVEVLFKWRNDVMSKAEEKLG